MKALHPVDLVAFDGAELHQSIANRFERLVALHPDRLAVKAKDHALTYGELNRRANRIGTAIVSALGVSSEPVALLFHHNASMICAIMGTLKANKFYVALDPATPMARNLAIIEDSGARLIITDDLNRRTAEELVASRGTILSVDEARDAHEADLGLPVKPEASAYIMYTSGSTGEPKGLVHSQRNVLFCAMSYVNGVGIRADDRFTLLARHNFAASISNLYGSLLAGASVFPYDVRENGFADLSDLLRREQITIYQSVPTLFRHFATSLCDAQSDLKLRIVKLSGETVFKSDVDLFKRKFNGSCQLLVSYGSTELNVVRQFFIDKRTEILGDVVPVGYAVKGVEVQVLDEIGTPMIGNVGEIAIRCRYLADGYWRKSELTAATFQQTPGDPTLRTYRTGDLGCLQTDGSLLHLGRKDHQVKIRGYRVECTEVEAALLGIAGVREGIVVSVQHADGERSLAAYVVPEPTSTINVRGLRASLNDRLPSYMVPARFVICDALPMTSNGKIDRLKLQRSEQSSAHIDRPYVEPANTLQYQLVVIWEELLNISPIGVTEDFFDAGGNSLLAARMLDAVDRECGKRLPLAVLTKAGTILDLANEIAQKEVLTVGSPLVKVQTGSGRPFFFLHGEFYRSGLYCDNLAKKLGARQTFYSLAPHGLDNGALPSIAAMAANNLRAIRAVQPVGPYLLGGWSNGGLIAFEMACQLEQAGESVGVLALLGPPCPNADLAAIRTVFGSVIFSKLPRWFVRLRTITKWPMREKLRHMVFKLRGGGKTSTAQARSLSIWSHYILAIRRYVPRRYGGRVSVFWGSDEKKEPAGVLRLWHKLAHDVDFNVVPGDHDGYVREYVGIIGEAIEQRLRAFREKEAAKNGRHPQPDRSKQRPFNLASTASGPILPENGQPEARLPAIKLRT
jgi:amino acid adenylation domain-containing protein